MQIEVTQEHIADWNPYWNSPVEKLLSGILGEGWHVILTLADVTLIGPDVHVWATPEPLREFLLAWSDLRGTPAPFTFELPLEGLLEGVE